MESILDIAYRRHVPDCLRAQPFHIDDPLRAYRTRNDAVFFTATLGNRLQALHHVAAFTKAVAIFNSVSAENEGLMVEGTAWISGTPITDAKIGLSGTPQYFDIIGPSVDIGSDLMDIADTRFIALSFDLAMMLIESLKETGTDRAVLPLVYHGTKRFASFFDGEPYPKIAIDSLQGLQSEEELITGKTITLADHDRLYEFCCQLREKYDYPYWFITQEDEGAYAGPNAQWLGYFRTVSAFRNTLRRRRSSIIERLREESLST